MPSPGATTRILHVANGTCTTRLIEAAGLPGATSLWADPLHDGPVPGGLTDDQLVEVRARHLGGARRSRRRARWHVAAARHARSGAVSSAARSSARSHRRGS